MLVAVHPASEIEGRAASALAAHPRVTRVGLLGRTPHPAWRSRIEQIDTAEGYDVVIGSGGYEEARRAGAVLVVPGDSPDAGPTIAWASPRGLAKALATKHRAELAASTTPGEPSNDGTRVGFPAPLGWLHAPNESDGVLLAPVNGTLGGVAVTSDTQTFAVVDDRVYLTAISLAAGAFIASKRGVVASWERSEDYLAACEELGLVIAEALSPGFR